MVGTPAGFQCKPKMFTFPNLQSMLEKTEEKFNGLKQGYKNHYSTNPEVLPCT